MYDFKIRPAQEQDAEALTRCIDAAYATYRDRMKDLPAVSQGIADDIKTHRVLVAELDQTVVGGLSLIFHDVFAVLANIAVSPESSGQGLGRRLIERAEEECRTLGLQELRLTTHVAIPENILLYERLGWTETGRAGSKVHMTKQL